MAGGTPITGAVLNAGFRPTAQLAPGSQLPVENIDTAGLLAAIGDTLAGRNYLHYCNFWPHLWDQIDGVEVGINERIENAQGWWLQWQNETPMSTSGQSVLYARIDDAPDGSSAYAAEIIGNSDALTTEFGVWVPAAICGQLRMETALTFSVYVKNVTGGAAQVFCKMWAAESDDDLASIPADGSVAPDDDSLGIALTANEWTRVQWTFDASATANFKHGVFLAISTENLNADTKSMLFAQAQLEVAPAATVFRRPLLPPVEVEDVAVYPELLESEKTIGGYAIVQLKNGQLRHLPDPPASFNLPVVGWVSGIPVWVDANPAANKQVFRYTGLDQTVTVPAGKTSMEIKCWGAGGSWDGGIDGGVGGFSKGTKAVTAGDQFTVVVGQGQNDLAGRTYGFGGYGQGGAHQHNGGGLSGVFSGATPVVAADTGRALVVAGGGGASGQSGGNRNRQDGGNGNDVGSSGGGTGYMQGNDSSGGVSSGNGGGGGGYQGGAGWGLGGKGGTGYTAAGLTSVAVQSTAWPGRTVPNSGDADYDGQAGKPGTSGLVIITFS